MNFVTNLVKDQNVTHMIFDMKYESEKADVWPGLMDEIRNMDRSHIKYENYKNYKVNASCDLLSAKNMRTLTEYYISNDENHGEKYFYKIITTSRSNFKTKTRYSNEIVVDEFSHYNNIEFDYPTHKWEEEYNELLKLKEKFEKREKWLNSSIYNKISTLYIFSKKKLVDNISLLATDFFLSL